MAVPLPKYEPIILATVYLTGVTYRFGTTDFYDGSDNYFKGTLIEDPELTSQLSDLYYGVETSSSVTLKFANRDNGLDDTWDQIVITNAKELRGRWILIQRYDSVPWVNKVKNGIFDTDTDWTKGVGWDIGVTHAGKAHCDGSQTGNSNIIQDASLVIGKSYRISFTLSNYNAGIIKPLAGGNGVGTARSANGTYHETIVCAGDSIVYMVANATFVGSIDDVEIYELADPVFEFRGKITSYKLGSIVEITIEMRDDDILEVLLPLGVVTNDAPFTATALDVGEPINIPFGHCRNVPLRNIQNNTGANQYDYLIGYGTIESLWISHANDIGVKRDGVLVDTTEYTFDDGTGAPTDHGYAGYATIRFAKEQMDFTGNFHKLTADVYGLELGGATAERNFATVIKNILTDTTWGLSDNADAASFTAAATALDTIGNMYCDGAVTKQRKARDIINDLLFPARARIWRATDGEWEIDIDDGGASVLNLGENDGYYDNCEVLEASSVVSTEALKTAIVHYSLDPSNEEIPFKELTVSAHSGFGIDRTYDLPFVMEDNTAIRVLSYLKNRSIYSDKTVVIRGGMECRDLSIGKIITLTSSLRVISAKEYMIENITKTLSSFQLECREYSASIYGNEAIGPPTGPTGRNYVVQGPETWVGPIILGDGINQSATVTLTVAPGQGDIYIAAGKTDFTTAQNGFILGIDDSDADKVKFYIGDATDYMYWNGANLVLSGNITANSGAIGGWNIVTGYLYSLAGGTPTAAPDDGVVLASGNPALIVYENTEKRIEVGYLAAGIYGIRGYDNDGVTVTFELSDTQKMIGGWNFDNTYLWKLVGGTPAAAPSDGLVLDGGATPTITCYENAEKRVEIGYLAAGIYGVVAYDDDGAAKLLEVSDTQKMISGWTISTSTFANGTDIILDASNKRISIKDAVFGNAGIQIQYNANAPQMYIGDGANEYWKYTTAGGVAISTAKANAITIKGGGDIQFIGNDANPGWAYFVGTSHTTEIGADTDGDRFRIGPSTDNVTKLLIGSAGGYWLGITRFLEIRGYSSGVISLNAGDPTEVTSLSTVLLSPATDTARFYVHNGTIARQVVLDVSGAPQWFGPGSVANLDLGTPTLRWDTCYLDQLDVSCNVASGFAGTFINDGNNSDRYGIKVQSGADAGTLCYILHAYDGNGDLEGYLRISGGNFELIQASDKNRKQNIRDTAIDALGIINDLRICDFEFKKIPDISQINLIANEVREVFPDAVSEFEGELWLSSATFIPIIIRAMQQQQVEINALRSLN